MAEDESVIVQLGLTALVIIMMIPGLIVEPGPISEIIGVGAIATIWGFTDIFTGD